MYLVVGGAAVALVAVVAIIFLAAGGGRGTRVVRENESRPATARKSSTAANSTTAKGLDVIEIEIPSADRTGVSLRIDGQPEPIPSSGEVRVTVPAGNRELVLRRQLAEIHQNSVRGKNWWRVACGVWWNESVERWS